MKLLKAEKEDLDRIAEFYRIVSESTECMTEYGRWIYGLHPTDEMIRSYVNDGHMYYSEEAGQIVSAVAVTRGQPDDYRTIHWQADVCDDAVAVVHLLCVNPGKQKKGLGKETMSCVLDRAKAEGMKTVRLDALCCNTPAHRLYGSLGFIRCGTKKLYADNTGLIDFYFFERLL